MGPTALANAHTIPTIPKYFPRFRMLKRSEMQILTKIIKPPPPIPWIALAAINMPMFMLTAANKLPIKKTAAAISSTGFLPQISLNLPHDGVLAALASRYAEPIQVYPAFEWKYSLIVGSAVVMIVVSSAARKTAAQSEAMMTTVWKVERSSSGFVEGGLGAGGSITVAASSSTLVLNEPLGRGLDSMEGEVDCV
jgi:hypothetical protein